MPDDIDDFSEPTPEAAKLSRFDLRNLWRVTFWGAAAALAVVVVAGTAFSDVGAERVKEAIAAVLEQAKPVVAQVPPVQTPPIDLQRTAEIEKQTQQLAQQTQQIAQQTQQVQKAAQELRDALKQLAADRDQLKGRVALLEQNLDDITGAIKRQATQQATQPSAQSTPQPPKEPVTAIAPPPAVTAPPTVTASVPDPANVGPPAEPIAAPVPLPPMRIAALAPAEPADAKREFGIDLGGAATLEQVRIAWSTIKANVGPDLIGVRPAYMQRQKQSGAIEYRLVLVGGPRDNVEAMEFCGKLAGMRLTCRPGHYRVSHLAER